MAKKEQLVSLIPIKKMDRAIEFYTKKLGAKLQMRGEGEMADGWAAMNVAGCDVWFVNPGEIEKRKLAYHTFVTPNIKKFVAGLQKRGVKFDKADPSSKETKVTGPIAWEMYGASAFFKDSEGNLLMAWQNAVPM